MKFYKLLLVDDENTIRTILPSIIPFNSYGFEVCDIASNGQEALEKVRENKPDVILLDIRMPEMDGIEFLHQLRAEQIMDIEVVIMSGYSEFEYVRQALKLGVREYLCKPIDEEELFHILEKIYQGLEYKYRMQDKKILQNEWIEIKNIYMSGAPLKKKYDGYSFLHIVILQIGELNEEIAREKILSQIKQVMNLDSTFLFVSKGCSYTYLIHDTFLEELQLKRRDLIELIKSNLSEEGIKCVFLWDRAIFNNIELSFRLLYQEHYYNLLTDLFYHIRDIYEYREDKEYSNWSMCLPDWLVWQEVLLSQMNEECSKYLETIFEEIVMEKPRIEAIEDIQYRIYYFLEKILANEFGIQEETTLKRPDWKEEICFLTFYDWRERMRCMLKGALLVISDQNNRRNQNQGELIINYVKQHYREAISLNKVAQEFHMHSKYLGKLFIKYTGKPFNTYLNEIRIEEAKKLLTQTNKLIYEVSEHVGYSECKYFVVKFEQIVGVSPSTYRQQKTKSRISSLLE